jgi:putative inorganic carbon (hco3(-)) transporter
MTQGTLTLDPVSFGAPPQTRRTTLAYRALVLFSFIYFFRPEDFIPGLNHIPLGKIAGGVALLALIFGVKRKDRGQMPLECKILIALLVQMLLTVPTAFWKGGALDTIVNKFSKGVIVALLITLVITKMSQLRRLLVIQAAAVALVTIGSLALHHTKDGRLNGIQKGILENPNDLAINIAINFPLCMAFVFASKSGVRKVAWSLACLALMYGVVATYSRSGMIAMVISCLICLWEFGLKGKRFVLLGTTFILGVLGVAGLVASPKYAARLASLVQRDPGLAGAHTMESQGETSLQAREQLLKESFGLMLRHPLFGVGPGNFPAVTQEWRVAHNTYTELGAETGLPGLLLFLALLVVAIRRMSRIRKLPGYATDPQIRLWASALSAAITGYAAGAMFASTEYNLFPYFIVGYICALYHIASRPENSSVGADAQAGNGGGEELGYGGNKERELVWSR